MYKLDKSSALLRSDPWNIPFEDRIEKIRSAKRSGQRTAAYLYPGFDSSTFRYRGFNMAEALEYSFYWGGACFQYGDRARLEEHLDEIDVMVLIRCCMDAQMTDFLSRVREKGIRVCYDIDDLVCMPGHASEVMEALGLERDVDLNYWYGLIQRNYEIARQCDCFITTTDALKRFIDEYFGKPVFVMHNFLNWYQERVSEEYFRKKMKSTAQPPFEIGYFSGSPTHEKDIAIILPEIEPFLMEHEDAVLRIVGHLRLPDRYRELIVKGRICFVPFQPFIDLQYELAKVNVNVVPLKTSDFTDCKSELKYFESAITGTVTCASPSKTFSKVIENGDNGYLPGRGQWRETLEMLYQDPDNYEQMSRIRERALREYSGERQVRKIEALLDAIAEGK